MSAPPAASELLYLLTIFPFKFNSAAFCTEDYLKATFDILNPTISELSENRKGTGINAWSINSGSARGNWDGQVSFPKDPAGLRAVKAPTSCAVFWGLRALVFLAVFKSCPQINYMATETAGKVLFSKNSLAGGTGGQSKLSKKISQCLLADNCHEPCEIWTRKKIQKK